MHDPQSDLISSRGILASDGGPCLITPDTNIVILVRSGHRYIFTFSNERKEDVLLTVGRWASHPDLPGFGWEQAAAVSAQVKELVK